MWALGKVSVRRPFVGGKRGGVFNVGERRGGRGKREEGGKGLVGLFVRSTRGIRRRS